MILVAIFQVQHTQRTGRQLFAQLNANRTLAHHVVQHDPPFIPACQMYMERKGASRAVVIVTSP